MKKFLCLSVIGILQLNLWAWSPSSFEVDGMWFEIENDEAVLVDGINEPEVIIPSSVSLEDKDYPVSTIENGAFKDMKDIKTLSIPGSVKMIKDAAFKNTDIEVVKIEDLTSWCSIYFYDSVSNPISLSGSTSILLNDQELSSLRIPNEIETIGDFAFRSYLKLKELHSGENLKKIGNFSFTDCSGLEKIDLGDKIEEIGESAFSYCTSLEDLGTTESLKVLGSNSLSGCKKIKSFRVSDTIESIGYGAFFDSGIDRIDIPSLESWINLKKGASFYEKYGDCFNQPYGLYLNGEHLENIVVSGELETLNDFCFNYCDLKTIYFEEGLKTIGKGCFNDCKDLYSIYLPESIEFYGMSHLTGCDNLRKLYINKHAVLETVDSQFGENAFYKPVLENCTLYVPEDMVQAYKDDLIWGCFSKIEGMDFAGKDAINIMESIIPSGETKIFDLKGRCILSKDAIPGIYILNGRKIVKK